MIKLLHRIRIAAILLAVSCICALSGFAQENAVPIPAESFGVSHSGSGSSS